MFGGSVARRATKLEETLHSERRSLALCWLPLGARVTDWMLKAKKERSPKQFSTFFVDCWSYEANSISVKEQMYKIVLSFGSVGY